MKWGCSVTRLRFRGCNGGVDVDMYGPVLFSPSIGGIKIFDAKTGDTLARLDTSTMLWTLGTHPAVCGLAGGPWSELEIL